MKLARRGQSGMTLVETLLALTLAVLIAVPMLGWAQFTFSEQVRTKQRDIFATDVSALRTTLHRDVASADQALVSGDRFHGCDSEDVFKLLLVTRQDDSAAVIGYAVAPGTDDGSSIWRYACSAPDTAPDSSIELVTDVDPSSVEVLCESTRRSQKGSDGSCPRLTLRLRTGTDKSASIAAMVRSDWVLEGASSGRTIEAPLVSISAEPTKGLRNTNVSFSSDGSSAQDGGNLTYLWEFGDGASSTKANPKHNYHEIGTYSAVLTVTDASGVSSSSFLTIEIINRLPVAVIKTPVSGTETHRGEAVSFSSAGSNDPGDPASGGGITSYHWDFGDGTSSTEPSPDKVYSTVSPPGGFTVVLRVTDSDGGVGRAQTKVVVSNKTPQVTISASPQGGSAPLTTTFAASVTDETSMEMNPSLSYQWSFGNGSTSTEANPAPVTYASPGTYTVTVVVTDDRGATATDQTTVTVAAASTPITYPRNLKRVKVNPQPRYTMSFDWSSVAGADAYWLELSCNKCGDPIDWIVTGTSATVNITRANTQYTIRIRARAAATALWGDWSPTIKSKSDK